MTCFGQLPTGSHAGSWAHVATLDAETPERLTPEERAYLAQELPKYSEVVLYDEEHRVLWRGEGAALLGKGGAR